jgi:hypothetical protein
MNVYECNKLKRMIKRMIQAVTEMVKQRLQVTIRKDLVDWMQTQKENGVFSSYSHAIERALIKLKEAEEKKA